MRSRAGISLQSIVACCFFLLLWASPVWAADDIGSVLANDAAEVSASSVYNLDVEQLPVLLKHFAAVHPDLMGLEIIENIENAVFFQCYRDNDALIYDQDLPEAIKTLNTHKADIHYEGEAIGHVVVYYAGGETRVELTPEERAWVKQHPTVRVASDPNWPPFEYRDEQGQYKGIGADLVQLVGKRVGIEFEPAYDTWTNILSKLEGKELDLSPALNRTPDREKFLVFTDAWSENSNSIICRVDRKDIASFDDLQDKVIAVEEGYSLHEFYKSNYPNLNILVAANTTEALRAVSTKKADAYVGAHWASQYLLQKINLSDLNVVGFYDESIQRLYMGVRDDYPILRDIIQKGLNSVSSAEKTAIINRYIYTDVQDATDPSRNELTEQEKEWLKENPVIRIGADGQYPPFDYIDDNGQFIGIAADYLKIISDRLGVSFKVVPNLSWSEVLEGVQKDIVDLIPVVTDVPERRSFLSFTKPYVDFPNAIIMRAGTNSVETLDDLANKTIALTRGYSDAQMISQQYPSIKVELVETPLDCLKAVVLGKADATYGNMAVLSYLIQKNSLINLTIVALSHSDAGGHCMGVRKDWPELASILQKTLASIDQRDKQAIHSKWGGLHKEDIPIDLTPEERAWLQTHPKLRVHNEKNWPPFNYYKDGSPLGFSIDFMNILAKRIGVEVEYVSGEWGELLDMAFNKELDVMLNIVKNAEREQHLLYAGTYAKNPNVIVSRKDESISNAADLSKKKVAYPKGFFYDALLKEKFPNIYRTPMVDTLAALKALQFNQVDAVLGEVAVIRHLMRENLLTGIEIKGVFDAGEPEIEKLNIAVRNDWPELQSILEKAIASVTVQERSMLQEKWLGATGEHAQLSQEELTWLVQNPKLRITVDPDWMPLEQINPKTGAHEGVIADYLELISQRSGLFFEIVPAPTWQDATELVVTNEVQGFSGVKVTPERETYLSFSDPYLTLSDVIVTRKKSAPIAGIEGLVGLRVGVVKGYWIEELVRSKYPEVEIATTSSTLQGLKKVAAGDLDAFIDDHNVATFLMNRHSLSSLQIAASTSNESTLHIGLLKDMSQIPMGIINKAIGTISSTDKLNILQRWRSVSAQDSSSEPSEVSDEGNTWVLVAMTLVAFLAIALVIRYGLRASSEESLAIKLGSKRFRYIVILSLLLLVVFVAVMSWFTLRQNRLRIRENVATNLEAVHESTVKRLQSWAEQHKKVAKSIGQNPDLVQKVKALLAVPEDRDSLLGAGALEETREFFARNEALFEAQGFFIINKDQVSIGSRRDTNIGTKNLIAMQRPRLLQNVFNGEAVFVPPVYSDVVLSGALDEKSGEKKPPTMFFAAPVQDENGSVIAVMTLRVDPGGDFTQVLQSGRMGESGESYAFDEDALMVSGSRFEEDLYSIGLLKEGEASMLRLRITDPGRNLFESSSKSQMADPPLTLMAESAVKMQSGMNLDGYRDYRGVLVCGVWSWDEELGLGIATEIDYSEAFGTYEILRNSVVMIVAVTLILAVGATLFTLFLGERTSKALIKARDKLEDRVKERTAELREASEKIKKSEQQIRAMSDSSSDAMIMLNSSGVVLFWNAAAEQMFGHTAAEALGGDMHKLFVPEKYHPAAYKGLEEFARTGKGVVTEGLREETALRRDGSPFPVELAVSSFQMGGQWYAVGTVRDITERKEAEAALSESEERTRLILSSAGEGIFGVDLDGKVIFINDAACTMLQYGQAEIMGQPVHDLIHHTRPDGSHYPVEECPMRNAFTDGISSRVDNEVLWRKDGTSIEVEYSAVPVMRGDEKMGAVISFQDITARRAAERQRDDAHNIITSSIQYASRIQRSVLPPIDLLEMAFDSHSILWEPRDVVGGDIYWCKQWGDGILFILGDCTGHGVPGAFMTLIATGALELAMLEVEPGDPGRVVSLMHKYIQEELGQHVENGESDDGLELGACYIPVDKKSFTFAGAHFPLFILEGEEVTLIKGDKKGIGYRGLPADQEFTNHIIDVVPGQRFFITSDGLIDQVGGPKRRSYGKKRIRNLLVSLSDRPVSEVSAAVFAALLEFQGDENRRDDLSAIAFEL